jgi:hypothetical protein
MQDKKETNQTRFGLKRATFFSIAGAGIGGALHYSDWKNGHYNRLVCRQGLGLIFTFSFLGFGASSLVEKPMDPLTKLGAGAGLGIGGGLALIGSASGFNGLAPREAIFLTLFAATMGAGVGKALNNSALSYSKYATKTDDSSHRNSI